MRKMVVFDLDGTLLDTLGDLADAGNYALTQQGFPIHETEKYKYFVGNGIPKLIERILPERTAERVKKETYKLFCSYYNRHMNDKTKPYKGARELLCKLKEKGVVSVVVTNKDHKFAVEMIRKYFGDSIEAVYGSIEGFPKKPDPYWVNTAICDFGVKKDDVIYVGDSGVDMITAENATVFSCGVTWGFRTEAELKENGADQICESFEKLYEIIAKRLLS